MSTFCSCLLSFLAMRPWSAAFIKKIICCYYGVLIHWFFLFTAYCVLSSSFSGPRNCHSNAWSRSWCCPCWQACCPFSWHLRASSFKYSRIASSKTPYFCLHVIKETNFGIDLPLSMAIIWSLLNLFFFFKAEYLRTQFQIIILKALSMSIN